MYNPPDVSHALTPTKLKERRRKQRGRGGQEAKAEKDHHPSTQANNARTGSDGRQPCSRSQHEASAQVEKATCSACLFVKLVVAGAEAGHNDSQYRMGLLHFHGYTTGIGVEKKDFQQVTTIPP